MIKIEGGDDSGKESNDSSKLSPEQRAKEASQKVVDYSKYIQLMDNRVA